MDWVPVSSEILLNFLTRYLGFLWFGKASEVITSLAMSSLNSILISFRDRSEDIRPNRTFLISFLEVLHTSNILFQFYNSSY